MSRLEPLTMSPYASSTMPSVSMAPGRKATSGGTSAWAGSTGRPRCQREENERGDQRRRHDGQRDREHRPVPVEHLQHAHDQAQRRRRGNVHERRHQHDRHPDRQDRVPENRAKDPEPRGLFENRGKTLQPFARRHIAALRRVAEFIDVGDLIQSQGLRRSLGQCDALLLGVVQADEHRRRKRHDSRPAHAVSRRSAAEDQFHGCRLLAAGETAPAPGETGIRATPGDWSQVIWFRSSAAR